MAGIYSLDALAAEEYVEAADGKRYPGRTRRTMEQSSREFAGCTSEWTNGRKSRQSGSVFE